MSDEAADKAAVDAQRLLDSDGPHLRKWMNDEPLNFIETVHRVATAVLTPPRPLPGLAPPPDQAYAPPEETARPRAPAARPLRKG